LTIVESVLNALHQTLDRIAPENDKEEAPFEDIDPEGY